MYTEGMEEIGGGKIKEIHSGGTADYNTEKAGRTGIVGEVSARLKLGLD